MNFLKAFRRRPSRKQLLAENERLVRLLASHTDLISAQVENGEFEIVTRPPQWAVRAMAASFFETLDNAPNWQSVEVGPMDHDGTRMIVTVRRASGQTPEETVTLLKEELARATEANKRHQQMEADLIATNERLQAEARNLEHNLRVFSKLNPTQEK